MDGYPMVAVKANGAVHLVTRQGKDFTKRFPELAKVLGRLNAKTFILDGEVAVFDKDLKIELADTAHLDSRWATINVVEVEDLPLADLPGNSLRTRVRVVGEIARYLTLGWLDGRPAR